MQEELSTLENKENELNEEIQRVEVELETLMNDKNEMVYAYLTESDTQTLLNSNKIRTPFVLIEAAEDTKVEYLIP